MDTGGIDPDSLDPSYTQNPLVFNPVEEQLSLFLVQVMIILTLVRLLAKALAYVAQPPVIGEIIAGVVLGPSILGAIPGYSQAIFPAESLPILNIFAQVGLIFFMYFLGLEIEPTLFTRSWQSAVPAAVISIIVPFAVGSGLSFWLYNIEYTPASHTVFLLFVGTSLAFTAFPVLARILSSFRLLDTPFGLQCLSIAAIDDVLAWCVLALVLSYSAGGSAVNGLYTMLIVVGFILFLVFVLRPLLDFASEQLRPKGEAKLNRDYTAILFMSLCMCSMFTEVIGVHAFFGAFAFGIITPKHHNIIEELGPKIEFLIVEFFLPLYFAISGLRTDLSTLNTGEVWGAAAVVIVLVTIAKVIPVALMVRATSQIGMPLNDDEYEADQKRLDAEKAAANKKVDDIEMVAMGKANMMKPRSAAERKDDTAVLSNGAHSDDDPLSTTSDAGKSGAIRLPNLLNGFGLKRFFNATNFGGMTADKPPRAPVNWRTCLSIGIMMNTTGLIALIALNIGLDRGILGKRVFTILVVMALVTTFMTSPIIKSLFVAPMLQRVKNNESAADESEDGSESTDNDTQWKDNAEAANHSYSLNTDRTSPTPPPPSSDDAKQKPSPSGADGGDKSSRSRRKSAAGAVGMPKAEDSDESVLSIGIGTGQRRLSNTTAPPNIKAANK